jgi:hypothetical protein
MVLYVLEPNGTKVIPLRLLDNIQSLRHTTRSWNGWMYGASTSSGAAQGRATSTFPSLGTSTAAALPANLTSHSRAGRWIATFAAR